MHYWTTFDTGVTGTVTLEPEDERRYRRTLQLAREAGRGDDEALQARIERGLHRALERRSGLDAKVVGAKVLPYPGSPRLAGGEDTPSFCMTPSRCAGGHSCPRRPSCTS